MSEPSGRSRDWRIRQGVTASTMVLPQLASLNFSPTTLLSFLEHPSQKMSSQNWAARLHAGAVLSEQGTPFELSSAYTAGQRIYYWRDAGVEPRIPFEERIVYQDERILVADKPHFLPVTPTGRYVQETLLVRLRQRTGCDEIAPIHRIDRDTAGLVLFSLRAHERGAYMQLFRDRLVDKTYECIAPFNAQLSFPMLRQTCLQDSPQSFMQMVEAEGVANSQTQIEQLASQGQWARYRLKPLTGKRHQLRVHMNALGLPMCGDGIYPVLQPEPSLDALHYDNPLRLLAQRLAFTDPFTKQRMEFLSSLHLDWPQDKSS